MMTGHEEWRPLKPGQRHPTMTEKKVSAREKEARERGYDRDKGKTLPMSIQERYQRASRAGFCSGGLPGLGKRR